MISTFSFVFLFKFSFTIFVHFFLFCLFVFGFFPNLSIKLAQETEAVFNLFFFFSPFVYFHKLFLAFEVDDPVDIFMSLTHNFHSG